MKRLRIVLSILLAAAMLLCVCVTAYALGDPPTNLHWEGKNAVWTASPDPGNGYIVTLYKNGAEVSGFGTSATTVDMSGGIAMNGEGTYTFSVCVDYGDVYTSEVFSDTYTYSYSMHAHSLKHIDFQYADCTSDGVKEHYECPTCGKWYWDSKGEYEITDHSEVILPAYGHNWGEWKVVQPATKTEKGIEMRVCAEDPDHAEYRDIPALGSDTKATTAPKATEKASEATEKATETAATDATQDPTVPTTIGSSSIKVGGTISWLIIGAIALIVIGVIIIVLVIVLRKRSNASEAAQPPVQQPVQTPDPYDPAPKAPDDFNDHFDNM